MPSKQQRRIVPEWKNQKKVQDSKPNLCSLLKVGLPDLQREMSESGAINNNFRKCTFSTTEVSLNVKYNPVVSDENRLPYSLFKKNRYQTGVGNNARYNSKVYSTRVSI